VRARAREAADIDALRGQSLALANPLSLVAMRGVRWLAEQNLRAGRDFRIVRASADDSSAAVVLRGDALLAMLSAGELKAVPAEQREQLVVITQFAEVPGFVMLANPRADADEVRRCTAVCLAFEQRAAQAQAFFSQTGVKAVLPLPAGVLESLDSYLDPTRRALREAA
jgi:phosphonate transport system substrate-binding protein